MCWTHTTVNSGPWHTGELAHKLITYIDIIRVNLSANALSNGIQQWCCAEPSYSNAAEVTDNIRSYKTISWDKALFKNGLVWMHFPAVADLIMINSLYQSEVGTQWSKPKSIRGSSGARCQRLSQAPSSKHWLPVGVFRNPLDLLGKRRNPTLQHLIIFQRVSWSQF